MINDQTGIHEEARATGLVFRLVAGEPGDNVRRYESVGGSLTYTHSSVDFLGCAVEGEITLPIPPGDAYIEMIGGGVYGARGSTAFEIPVVNLCDDMESFRFPSIWLEATGSQEEPDLLEGNNLVFGAFRYEWSFRRGSPLLPLP